MKCKYLIKKMRKRLT